MLLIALLLGAQVDAGPAVVPPLFDVGAISATDRLEGDVRGVVNGLAAGVAHCITRSSNVVVAIVVDRGHVAFTKVDHTIAGSAATWPLVADLNCAREQLGKEDVPLKAARPFSLTFLVAFPRGPVPDGEHEAQVMESRVHSNVLDAIAKFEDQTIDEPRREFDRFKGTTALKAELDLAPEIGFNQHTLLLTVFDGTAPKPGEGALLAFYFAFRDWHFLDCHSVAMLADDKPVLLGEPKHSGKVLESGVSEGVTTTISASTLATLASASKIEVRICRDEMRFSDHALRRVRAFAHALSAN